MKTFSKTAAEIIGEKINDVNESIKTREAVINVIRAVNGLIGDFDKKVYNKGLLKRLNAKLQTIAPFILSPYDENPGGARLIFWDFKGCKQVRYTHELLVMYTPGERRVDAAKTEEAGLALIATLEEANDGDKLLIENYKKMTAPLQKAFDAFEKFADIPGSAFIDAEQFISKEYISKTNYREAPAFHVYYGLLNSTFTGKQ